MFIYSSAARVAVTIRVHSSVNGIELPEVFGAARTVSFGRGAAEVFGARSGRTAGERTAEVLATSAGSLGGSEDRKSTRLNSSHVASSYAVSCSKTKTS